MNAMTVSADGDLLVSLRESFPVDARVILPELVGTQTGVVLAHECRVGMATPAKFRNLLMFDLSFPAGFAVHSFLRIITCRVAAVATHASKSLLRVNVLSEFLRRYAQLFWHSGVTVKTRVLCLTKARWRYQT